MAPPVLEVRQVSKSFKTPSREITVLRPISFTVHARETCAIVGPSGSGKTTLLGLCAGLDTPSSGDVHLAGQNLSALSEDGRARVRSESVGFVFQNFQLLPTLTALENVMVPLELRGQASQALPLARELLGRVGLAERTDHYPVQLSGGEQQRVAIARAFVNRPQILFADEPTGNLDAETAARIVELLFDLNAAAGTALVLVTHDLALAQKASQILRLRDSTRPHAPQESQEIPRPNLL